MRAWIKTAGAACLLAAAGVGTADAQHKDEKLTDEMFVKMAASSDATELKISEIAKTKAKDPEVKAYSERMIADHTKSSKELMAIVKEMGGKAPPKQPTGDHQKHVDMVKGLKTKEFDREYMKLQVEHHKEALDLVTRGSKELKNEKLKTFAAKLVPVVKEHTDVAKKIQDKLDSK